jgi:hypothetical protein
MANRWVGLAAGLVGGQVASRALSLLLSGRAGERLLTTIDRRALTPLEHRILVQKWSGNLGKAIAGAASVLALLWTARPDPEERLRRTQVGKDSVDWVQVMQRTAEVLLAIGAIVKVVAEFLEDRQQTAAETERAAAKRLA